MTTPAPPSQRRSSSGRATSAVPKSAAGSRAVTSLSPEQLEEGGQHMELERPVHQRAVAVAQPLR